MERKKKSYGVPPYAASTDEELKELKNKHPVLTIDDSINHPKHYTEHPSGIECIQIVEHMSFLRGNAMKYLWRADHKNGLEDLKKARWYLEREIDNMENKEAKE